MYVALLSMLTVDKTIDYYGDFHRLNLGYILEIIICLILTIFMLGSYTYALKRGFKSK